MHWTRIVTAIASLVLLLSPIGCSTRAVDNDDFYADGGYRAPAPQPVPQLASSIPAPGEKVIIVDPRSHAWGAYTAEGSLAQSGLATCGGDYCPDLGRPCRTKTGSFRIFSKGNADCISHKFPLRTHGGAPMPYCMFFNGGQALHGDSDREVVYGNISHGCVRMHTGDAAWLSENFVEGPNKSNGYRGTKVVVQSY